MKANDICKGLGISYKSLRVYEEKGLVVPKRISDNNYREYKKSDIWKLKCIKILKELGLSLDEIKEILAEENYSNDNLNKLYSQLKVLETRLIEISIMKETINKGINILLKEKINSREKFLKTIIGMEKVLEQKKDEERKKKIEWNEKKFDEVANNYVEIYFKNDIEYIAGMKLLKEKIKKEKENMKILDIGCGTSEYWQEIGENFNLYGIDYSLNMLMLSKKNIPTMKVFYGDITNYDNIRNFSSLYGKMKLITMCFTLHHIKYEEQILVLKNIFDLLENDGKIIIIDRMFKDKQDKKEKLIKMDDKIAEIIDLEFYCYVDEIKKFLNKYGLKYSYTNIIDQLWYFEIEKN